MFCFKFTGLVLCPYKAGKLGDRGLGSETVDIANFSDNTGGVNLANAWNRGQGIWDNLKLLFNGFVQNLGLFLQCPHRGDRNGHCLVHSVVHCLGQTVRSFGRSLYYFRYNIRVGKSASACLSNKVGQFIQISICQIIHSFKMLHERNGSGAGVLNALLLSNTGAL